MSSPEEHFVPPGFTGHPADTPPEEEEYSILTDPEERQLLAERTADLLDVVLEYRPDVLVYMDRAARPFYVLFKKMWESFSLGSETPAITFLNIGKEKEGQSFMDGRGYLRSLSGADFRAAWGDAALDEAKKKYGVFSSAERVLLVDDVRRSGNSLTIASSFLKSLYPDLEVQSFTYAGDGYESRLFTASGGYPSWRHSPNDHQGFNMVGVKDDPDHSRVISEAVPPTEMPASSETFLRERFAQFQEYALQLQDSLESLIESFSDDDQAYQLASAWCGRQLIPQLARVEDGYVALLEGMANNLPKTELLDLGATIYHRLMGLAYLYLQDPAPQPILRQFLEKEVKRISAHNLFSIFYDENAVTRTQKYLDRFGQMKSNRILINKLRRELCKIVVDYLQISPERSLEEEESLSG